MLTSSPTVDAALSDFHFALIAAQLRRDQFDAKVRRVKRRGSRTLLFVGMVLVTLNFLLCMAFAVFHVALDTAAL